MYNWHEEEVRREEEVGEGQGMRRMKKRRNGAKAAFVEIMAHSFQK